MLSFLSIRVHAKHTGADAGDGEGTEQQQNTCQQNDQLLSAHGEPKNGHGPVTDPEHEILADSGGNEGGKVAGGLICAVVDGLIFFGMFT